MFTVEFESKMQADIALIWLDRLHAARREDGLEFGPVSFTEPERALLEPVLKAFENAGCRRPEPCLPR